MKKHALLVVLGLAIVLLFLGNAYKAYQLDFVSHLEAKVYDYRLWLTMPETRDERVVILDIDEKSLKEVGRWPWSRDQLARLLDQLFSKYGVAIVGFDVVFAEQDNSSGLRVLQQLGRDQLKNVTEFQRVLAELKPQLEYDHLFAKQMQQRKVVLGYYLSNSEDGSLTETTGQLPSPVFAQGAFAERSIDFTRWQGYGANLPELQSNALSGGFFNPQVDFDGVVRRLPTVAEYQGAYYESLSLAVVRALIGSPPLHPRYSEQRPGDDAHLEAFELVLPEGVLSIPVDDEVSTLIPYRGERGNYQYVSAVDVLRGSEPLSSLQNKIVLVGTTAPGLMDMRATPVGEIYPGVEAHANLISGILDQSLKRHPEYATGAEVVIILLAGISLAFLLPRLAPINVFLLSLFALFGSALVNILLWHFGNIALPLAGGLLMILLLFALNMSYGYFIESRTKRQITNLFGQYVPGELVDEMSKNPEQVSMDGESREMSVLFSDVRNFTSISEGLSPRELSLLMNEFLTPLSRVIYNHRGTIDKYMGDCIMAFWGAPLRDPQHARQAVLAGLEMIRALEDLQTRFQARGWPPIQIGVGVNTGQVSVGNMGSDVRVAYTVMGDAVNLASRLEGITKEYGVGFIVGEETRRAAPEFVYRELDAVRVKGKDRPVVIFEPLGMADTLSPDALTELALFHDALQAYREQNWAEAESALTRLQENAPATRLYQIYRERVAYFRAHPPGDGWDGVFSFKTK